MLALLIFLGSVMNLENAPPLWWDEGWTLSVARNWVERGHYGRLLLGEPVSAHLSASFPVVAPIALSFRLLGVGVWQGRLPGVVFALAALAFAFTLAQQLYSRSVALGTLGVLLLMPIADRLHPVLMGRQVFGELPSIFYLLAGYSLFFLALERSAWWILAAGVFWGIALKAKAQVAPFWLASMALPLGFALLKRRWRPALLLSVGLFAGWSAGVGVTNLQGIILAGHTLSGEPLNGLYQVTAWVPDLNVRAKALMQAITFALPALLGIGYAAWGSLRWLRKDLDISNTVILRLALLGLAGSWMGWYLFLGMWWLRYLFPPVFFGGIFGAAFLYELTGHFDWRQTFRNARDMLFEHRLNRRTGGAFLAMVLIAYTVPLTVAMLFVYFIPRGEQPAAQVAGFLETHTQLGVVIETYDSELLFLSHRRIHYPPDRVSVQLQRRRELQPDLYIDYDPLAADPDYLVIGPFSSMWGLYDPVLGTGQFRLVFEVPNYQVYQRVR
jgi:4-amino-4-deoxy-L-arabinose transferase-like glycosyltransferase